MEECPVCLLEIDDRNRCITGCGHVYCEDCIESLFDRGRDNCPLCRAEITEVRVRDETRRMVIITREIPSLGSRVKYRVESKKGVCNWIIDHKYHNYIFGLQCVEILRKIFGDEGRFHRM
jgi:hypothetical protein